MDSDSNLSAINVSETLERSETFLSVVLQKNRLGIAAFTPESGKIFVQEIFEDIFTHDGVASAIRFFMPCHVILPQSVDERFYARIHQETQRISVQSSGSFNARVGRERLCSLFGSPAVQTVCSLSNEHMLRAVGGLFSHFTSRKIQFDRVPQSLHPYLPNDSVFVDPTTLKDLQIFKEERHPSAHGIGPSKEGWSIFSMLNFTASPLGKAKLRTILERPFINPTIINDRLDVVQFLMDPTLAEWADAATEVVKLVHVDASKLLRKVVGLTATARDWYLLLRMASAGHKFAQLGRLIPASNELFQKMRNLPDTNQLCDLILQSIDLDESAREGKVCVRSGVDPALDRLKSQYQNLPSLLNGIAEDLTALYPYGGLRCVYFPQSGFHIALPFQEGVPFDQQYPDPTLEYRFQSNAYIYYKTQHMLQMDYELHDIYHDMLDREMQALRLISDKAAEFSASLSKTSSVSADLDCFLSLAKAARQYGMCRPVLSDQNEFEIHGGWHPLQEQFSDVPIIKNDTNLTHAKFQILSGPNGSGKSCYLKQVGIIALLACTGSFVPADSCRISSIDMIVASTSYLHSSWVGSGALAAESQFLSRNYKYATAQSLLLMDEIGRATNDTDGTAIVGAFVDKTIARGISSPRAVIATHLHRLWDDEILLSCNTVQLSHMDFVLDGESISYLFRVASGPSSKAFALRCASIAGVPTQVLERAAVLEAQAMSDIESADGQTQGSDINNVLEELSGLILSSDGRSVDEIADQFIALLSH